MHKRVAVCHSEIVDVSFHEHAYQDYIPNASNVFSDSMYLLCWFIILIKESSLIKNLAFLSFYSNSTFAFVTVIFNNYANFQSLIISNDSASFIYFFFC